MRRVLIPHAPDDDYDSDGIGDACDPDDDNDGVCDYLGYIMGESCVFDENAQALVKDRCITSLLVNWDESADNEDYDKDGCRDSDEDMDTDNDGILNIDSVTGNPLDMCPNGIIELTLELDIDRDGCHNDNDIDSDGDGLIEIYDLLMLYNIRYVLDGSGYKAAMGELKNTTGCGGRNGIFACTGYELPDDTDLDFDISGNKSTFSKECNVINTDGSPVTDFTSCVVDAQDAVDSITGNPVPWFDSTQGWEPISNFAAVFNGNGNSIINLVVKRENKAGLFHSTTSTAEISNLGLKNALIIVSNSNAGIFVANNEGDITLSYAKGLVSSTSIAGGLVGYNNRGVISQSYAFASVCAFSSHLTTYAGGLIGENNRRNLESNYANGRVCSYSTGATTKAYAGGLIGINKNNGAIEATFSTADVYANANGNAYAGGLIGENTGELNANYATGNVFSSSDAYAAALIGNQKNKGNGNYWMNFRLSKSIGIGPSSGSTYLTEAQMKETATTFPNFLDPPSWNLGSNNEYPGLVWGECIHRPFGRIITQLHVFPVCSGDENLDDDGDTVSNAEDRFPDDPCAGLDTDGDRMPDTLYCTETSLIADSDDDEDGIPDNDPRESKQSLVKSGLCSIYLDCDDDGFLDTEDLFPADPSEYKDLDGDGTGDNSDRFLRDPCASIDADLDGFPYPVVCPNGPDGLALSPSVPIDNCPNIYNPDQRNSDIDADGDACDDNSDDDSLANDMDIDRDNDGLIEIRSIEMLSNIRYNLAGTGYRTDPATSPDDHGETRGAPPIEDSVCTTVTGLCGYELISDLDFDTDGDGTYTCSNLNDLTTCLNRQ